MSEARLSPELAESVRVFAALGDETRLHLVKRLARGNALSITQLAAGSPLTRQAITKHLHVLAGARIVQGFRHGREQLWELNPRQLASARHSLELIARQWDSALSRLKASVEEDRV